MNTTIDRTQALGIDASARGRSGYLQRKRERLAKKSLAKKATFAVVTGAVLFGLFLFRHLFVKGANPGTSYTVMTLAGLLFAAGLFVPHCLTPVTNVVFGKSEDGKGGVTAFIGKIIMSIFLGLIYFLVVTPVGILLRTTKGMAPFYGWGTAPATDDLELEGWVDKPDESDKRPIATDKSGKKLIFQPFSILQYFVKKGMWIFIPVVILLVVLGLILFFASGSALAPLIYTLF